MRAPVASDRPRVINAKERYQLGPHLISMQKWPSSCELSGIWPTRLVFSSARRTFEGISYCTLSEVFSNCREPLCAAESFKGSVQPLMHQRGSTASGHDLVKLIERLVLEFHNSRFQSRFRFPLRKDLRRRT